MNFKNSGSGLFQSLSRNGFIEPLLKNLTEFKNKMYSQGQFETIIEELVGLRPDLSLGSPPDVSKSNESRAAKQMPFLDPNDTNPLEMARGLVKSEDFSAGEEETIDIEALPKRVRSPVRRSSDVTFEPAAKRRRPAVVVEEESQTGLYIAALVGILALAMY